jgi:DNA polymerase-3 subunit delta
MRLRADQLAAALAKRLAPVYVLSGDEPLQLQESGDAIRAAARAAGFAQREVLTAELGFAWTQLLAASQSRSLFADKKVLDLRVPQGKPGKEGGQILQTYAAAPPPDTLLLVTLPKLERAQQQAKWLQQLAQAGVWVPIWPIEGPALVRWVMQRLQQAGLQPAPEVAPWLAAQVEGNLLAARQEIDKLRLLLPPGPLRLPEASAVVSEQARFHVFGLAEAALRGDPARCWKMLAGLQQEGIAAPVVLWALHRELSLLAELAAKLSQGGQPETVLAQVWPQQRRPVLQQALQRQRDWLALLGLCHTIDAVVKGAEPGDPWLLLEQLCARMA